MLTNGLNACPFKHVVKAFPDSLLLLLRAMIHPGKGHEVKGALTSFYDQGRPNMEWMAW